MGSRNGCCRIACFGPVKIHGFDNYYYHKHEKHNSHRFYTLKGPCVFVFYLVNKNKLPLYVSSGPH
jgi:hypothetical protein